MSKVLSFISDAEIEKAAESITLADVHRIIKLADRIFCLSVNKGPHQECMIDLEVHLAGDSEIKRMAGTVCHPHEPDEIEARNVWHADSCCDPVSRKAQRQVSSRSQDDETAT